MSVFGILMREFRMRKPQPGSPEMIAEVKKIIASYENAGEIILPIDDALRYEIISATLHVRKIKKLYESRNWQGLGCNPYLYGIEYALGHETRIR